MEECWIAETNWLRMQVMDQRYSRVARQSFALLVPLTLIRVTHIPRVSEMPRPLTRRIGMSSDAGGELKARTYCSKKQLVDQRFPRANCISHIIEAKVQSPIEFHSSLSCSRVLRDTPSNFSRSGSAKTSDKKKHWKGKKHRPYRKRGPRPMLRN